MKRINLIWIVLLAGHLFATVFFTSAASYGTTTFFSDKRDEKPPVDTPRYDVGLRSGNKYNGNNNNNSNNNNSGGGTTPGGSIFDQIINGAGSLFGDSTGLTKKSLFDWQKDSQDSGGSASDGSNDEFIMGARGESYENMSPDDVDAYNTRIASKFDFKDDGSQPEPKKSKLLFTNIIIPVDMTTQYVIIVLMIVIAVGSVTGYYFWKKELDKMGKKTKREDYD